MAIIAQGITRCAITGRLLNDQDNYVCFPPFPYDESESIAICSDACVLRDVFDQWEFKTSLLDKLKVFWREEFHQSTAFQIIFENEYFLVVEGIIEKKARIFFYQKAFFLDIPMKRWREFWEKIMSKWTVLHFKPYPTVLLEFTRKSNKITIRQDIETIFGYDAIELSIQEWNRFLQLQSVINNKQ